MLPCVKQERVLIVISTSGNSPNIVATVDYRRGNGVVTVGVVSFEGGAVKVRVDECLSLESEIGVYGPVESAHATPCDILATCLMRDRPTMAEVP